MSGLSITAYFPFARVKAVAQNVHAEGALIQVRQDRRWHPFCHNCLSPATSRPGATRSEASPVSLVASSLPTFPFGVIPSWPQARGS